MRHITFRFAVAFFSFLIGLVSVSIWFVQQQPSIKQTEVIAEQPAKAVVNSEIENPNIDCNPTIESRYSNYDYAYSIQIPEGMIGVGGCMTNHGFGIDLSHPTSHTWIERAGKDFWPQSYLYVDASYNAAEWQSLDEILKDNLKMLRDYDAAANIELISKTPIRLANLRAIRFVARYNKSGEAIITDQILAFRDHHNIVYTLAVSTPASRYKKDREALNKIQQSWRLQPLS